MNIASTSESTTRQILSIRQQLWRNQNIFVDRIYEVCNDVHPGIGLERAAVDHIQEILISILFEILECRPQKIEDMERCMRTALPASMCHWVMQFQETNEALHNLSSRKLHDKRDANSRGIMSLIHVLQPKIKEYLGYKVDEKVMLYILSLIEYITSDILKWTGNYVKNIRKGDATIGLQNLKIALNADKSLMELIEMLHNEEETSTTGILDEIIDENWKIRRELSYEQVSRDLNHEEEQYLRDLNLIIHVFRRRFECAFDTLHKHCLDEIFSNVMEIHELTVKVQRLLEDAVEMSDTPCVGAGLWELCEAQEFDVYIAYMKLFKHVPAVIDSLLCNTNYAKFFDMEDRSFSVTPGGQTFRLAVKYVLPTLLQIPPLHFFRYVEYINMLIHLSKVENELQDLKNAKNYFSTLLVKINLCCPISLKNRLKNDQNARGLLESNRSQQLRRIQEIQRSIDLWEGKEIGYTCSEVIREGDLHLLRPGIVSTSDTMRKFLGAADRHVFLFDHLFVLCKTLRCNKSDRPTYKYKSKVLIRKTDISDLNDTGELQNAFKIEMRSSCRERAPTNTWTFFCKSAEDKYAWMSDLVFIQTKGILDRMLDSSLKEEEKRIPLILPGPEQYRFAEQDCDDNIVFEDYTSSSGIPVVKHGTVLKLVERLTYHLYTDNNYVRTFLTTFRSFCQPAELLQLLIERFNVPIPHQLEVVEELTAFPHLRGLSEVPHSEIGDENSLTWLKIEQSFQRFRKEYRRPIQCRVLSVMRQWINGHWYDFESDNVLLTNLRSFLESADQQGTVVNQHRKWCKSIQTCIERKLRAENAAVSSATNSILENGSNSYHRAAQISFGPVKPLVVWHTAKKDEIEAYDLLSLHPLEIGRQITLLQFDLYRAIKPVELVGSAWTKHDKNRRSPQLLKLIDHSTMLTYWIMRSIVEIESLEERVYMFSRVLEIMAVFEELNNFTGLVAFYSALNSSSVYRLKGCWERIDREKQTVYEKFKKLCNPHWKEMIERLRSINPPCVPFFGHYLSKIFFYEEGNSTFVQNNDEDLSHEQVNGEPSTAMSLSHRKVMVSFVKCRRIAAIISDIQMYQNQPYALQVEPSIRLFFENINPLSGFDRKESFETYMWNQSLKIEPKDFDKLEMIKPSRPLSVLKSPGIKPPKGFTSVASTSGVLNHYSGYRGSGRGLSLNSNTYSVTHTLPFDTSTIAKASTASAPFAIGEDRNAHLGVVEINPGYQPRYLGDAYRGHASQQPESSSPKANRPPPLLPRVRKTSAVSISLESTMISYKQQGNGAPVLYPRRISPQSSVSPHASSLNTNSDIDSSNEKALLAEHFTPNAVSCSNWSLVEGDSSINSSGKKAPLVPPRIKTDALPAPLSPETVRVVWNGEINGSQSDHCVEEIPPKLYPRQVNIEPPPRPPKTRNNQNAALSSERIEAAVTSGNESPPPLPPKTYRCYKRSN